MHAVASIGLVGAIGVHGLPIVHAAQRRGHLDTHAAEGVGQDLFERAHDVVLVHEGHLDIDLGELGLTVGTQVLVAETLGNLIVALDATDHEQLLQELRGLRQGVEVARLDAAGDDEVAGALGRRLNREGVSTSMNSRLCSASRMAKVKSERSLRLAIISGRRRSR